MLGSALVVDREQAGLEDWEDHFQLSVFFIQWTRQAHHGASKRVVSIHAGAIAPTALL